MQVTTLLNPGQNPLAQTIRKEVARAISQLEDADVTGTPEDLFAAFLADAASKTPGFTAVTATVANAATVNVENSAGALDSAATAVVAAGVLTSVQLAASKTILTNAQGGVPLAIFANAAAIPGTGGIARVAAGVVSRIELPTTVGVCVNGVKQSGVTITGTGTFFTPTIVDGVLTGGVLSAS